jgi:hypothetical protein
MRFKKYLLENPDTSHRGDVRLMFADKDAMCFGYKGEDFCYINDLGKMFVNGVEVSEETLKKWIGDLDEILIDGDKFEFLGEICYISKRVHYMIAIAHYLLSCSNGKNIIPEEVLKTISEVTKDLAAGCYFELSGRLWEQRKVISFWEVPEKQTILDIFNKLKLNVEEYLIEIPVDVVTWEQKKIEDITGTEQKVDTQKIDHLLSPIAKAELEKTKKIKKDRVAKGLGSRKMLPGQKKDEVTAAARAKQRTSEETDEQNSLNAELKKVGLKRGNKIYKVGKDIHGEVYVQKQYENQFPKALLDKAKSVLPSNFKYDVVKFALKTGTFSFIISKDFDTNEEPSVNGGITVKQDGSSKTFSDHGWIYHHKWMFVGDDYKGFDVDGSKKRSLEWVKLPNIDKSRIGQWEYWNKNVLQRLGDKDELS